MPRNSRLTLAAACLCALSDSHGSGLFAENYKTLYSSLNPRSVAQQLAFYELYPETSEGKKALEQACMLLGGGAESFQVYTLPKNAADAIVQVVNHQPNTDIPLLSDQELQSIDRLSCSLPNRKLKGHFATTLAEIIALPPEEIDLARGVFMSQFGEEDPRKMRSYEAAIDLMALQIRSRLSPDAGPQEKIKTINRFVFDELGFRFPPHSQHAKDVDLYTFLPSVLDSRRGVCLGVSTLYLCLAQRLDLPLEIITPPGHIYIRYRDDSKEINIETTARGIHLDSEEYLGIDTKALQQRNIKEVIGLCFVNDAATLWKNERYADAIACYNKAEPFLPGDMLVKELKGYNHLFVGDLAKGEKLLREVKDYTPPHSVTKHTLAEDYLNGKVDSEGLKIIFMQVDENRESILKKKQALETNLSKYPNFREGWLSLGTAWLQLHREKEALQVFEHYHSLDPDDPTAEYYLAVLYTNRFNFKKAQAHLHNSKKIVAAAGHSPKALKNLEKQIKMQFPDYALYNSKIGS